MALEREIDQLNQRVSELDEQNRELRTQLQLQARARISPFELGPEKALDKEINDTFNEVGLPNDFLVTGFTFPNSFEMVSEAD